MVGGDKMDKIKEYGNYFAMAIIGAVLVYSMWFHIGDTIDKILMSALLIYKGTETIVKG